MSTIRKPTAKATMPEIADEAGQAVEAVHAKVSAIAVPDFLKPVSDFQEQIRAQAQKSADQFRAQYETFKGKAETATGKLEESFEAANAGARTLNLKIVDLFREQANAGFAHIEALSSAKTFGDAIRLNQAFVQAQAEALQAHSKGIAEFATKLAADVVEPARASVVLPFSR
ncbi:MAG: phasin family protein [Proteobacteria bacterium]|nr:phasin family protein [Pseudomonadota bacterium]